jgi:hypothetical protein
VKRKPEGGRKERKEEGRREGSGKGDPDLDFLFYREKEESQAGTLFFLLLTCPPGKSNSEIKAPYPVVTNSLPKARSMPVIAGHGGGNSKKSHSSKNLLTSSQASFPIEVPGTISVGATAGGNGESEMGSVAGSGMTTPKTVITPPSSPSAMRLRIVPPGKAPADSIRTSDSSPNSATSDPDEDEEYLDEAGPLPSLIKRGSKALGTGRKTPKRKSPPPQQRSKRVYVDTKEHEKVSKLIKHALENPLAPAAIAALIGKEGEEGREDGRKMEGRWRKDGGKMEGRGGKMEGRWREEGGWKVSKLIKNSLDGPVLRMGKGEDLEAHQEHRFLYEGGEGRGGEDRADYF